MGSQSGFLGEGSHGRSCYFVVDLAVKWHFTLYERGRLHVISPDGCFFDVLSLRYHVQLTQHTLYLFSEALVIKIKGALSAFGDNLPHLTRYLVV